MKTTGMAAAIAAVLFLSGCASSTSKEGERGGYSAGMGIGESSGVSMPQQTFYCPQSMGDCIAQAKEYCGELGYRRIRKPGGPSGDPMGGFYGGDKDPRTRAQTASFGDGTMTVECKRPKKQQ